MEVAVQPVVGVVVEVAVQPAVVEEVQKAAAGEKELVMDLEMARDLGKVKDSEMEMARVPAAVRAEGE